MKAASNIGASKRRPVNLTLNEELVGQAKSMTDNLSAVVEQLLTEFVSKQHRERLVRSQAVVSTVAFWNKFDEDQGSFADEYSTL